MIRSKTMMVTASPSAHRKWTSVAQLWQAGEVLVEVTVPRNQRGALQCLAHMFHMDVLESHEDNEAARQAIREALGQ